MCYVPKLPNPPPLSMSGRAPSTKVGPSTSRACARCRRQKLKCDVEKPCLLCRRAGLVCQGADDLVWKTPRVTKRKASKGTQRKPSEEEWGGVVMKFDAGDEDVKTEENTSDEYPDSSTLHLLKEFHQSNDLAKIDTSSLPRGEHLNSEVSTIPQESHHARTSFRAVAPRAAKRRSRSVQELLDVLPKAEGSTQLLVDTYFDRVHWFMLVFYQDSFRSRFSDLLTFPVESDSDFSFASVVLIVAALGLQYTCPWRRHRLLDMGVNPEALLLKLLGTIQSVLFDLIAIGDLESVRACILVGHFYIFHGCPSSALPIISCGTRIAQGMGLGRRRMKEWGGAEKRVWMAIFEIDRFCSMVYGLPISFPNEDLMGPGDYFPKNSRQNPSTLLFYKTHMAELSMILTDILRELYAPPSSRKYNISKATKSADSDIETLSRKVEALDRRVRSWYENIHPVLQLTTADVRTKSYESSMLMAKDIAGKGERFDRYILLTQAITLKFAFENAIIMTHRPLLSFRSAAMLQSGNNPCQTSIAACRTAALNTAAIGSWDVFEETLETYAASFFGIHIFTACVVLCLIRSFEPQSDEAKEGLQSLMEIQEKLRSKSVVASQGLEVLEKIMDIVVHPKSGEKRRPEVERNGQEGAGDSMQGSPYSDLTNIDSRIRPDGVEATVPGDSRLEGNVHEVFEVPQQLDFDTFGDQCFGYDLEMEYQRDPFLGAFTDIDQGWIRDPDWLVHM